MKSVLALIVCLVSLLTTPVSETMQQELEEKIEEYLNALEANGDFMGEVVFADRNGHVTDVVIGMADVESARAHVPGDIYHVASLTKQFTGAAIAKLASEGKLALDDSLQKYIPGFPHADAITIRGLVNQGAGVPDYNDFDDYAERSHQNLSLEEVVDWIACQAGDFEPNRGYSYSNSQFVLLARIIEIASGSSYREYMRQNIFDPAGMNDSGNFTNSQIVMRRVAGYDPGPGRNLVNAPVVINSIKLGSGSLYTTAQDLLRWHRALLNNTVLSEKAKDAYLHPSESGYAMGNSVWQDDHSGEHFAAHDGKSPGGFAYMKRWLDSKQVLIVLSNVNSGQLNRMKMDLTKMVSGEPVELPKPRKVRRLQLGEADPFVGQYLFPPDNKIRIAMLDGGLVLYWRNTGLAQYLEPLADSEWYFMSSRAERIRFTKNPEGRTVALEYDWGGGIQECPRVENSQDGR